MRKPNAAYKHTDVVLHGYGERIRKARKRKGMTLYELGNAIDACSNIVGQYEREVTAPRDIEIWRRLSTALGVPISDLIGEGVLDYERN